MPKCVVCDFKWPTTPRGFWRGSPAPARSTDTLADIQALDTLLEQATGARDSALDQHRRALSAADAARRQGEQLADYRKEYVRRFGTQPGRAGSVELLQCYHGFMARLDDAVSQQAQLATQAARRAEDA